MCKWKIDLPILIRDGNLTSSGGKIPLTAYCINYRTKLRTGPWPQDVAASIDFSWKYPSILHFACSSKSSVPTWLFQCSVFHLLFSMLLRATISTFIELLNLPFWAVEGFPIDKLMIPCFDFAWQLPLDTISGGIILPQSRAQSIWKMLRRSSSFHVSSRCCSLWTWWVLSAASICHRNFCFPGQGQARSSSNRERKHLPKVTQSVVARIENWPLNSSRF